MRILRTWLLTAVALFTVSGFVAAQTTNGTISGHVADAQGLGLPGVTVNAASPNLQGIRSVVSSENGDYVFALLPPGTYTITFDLSGFERQERTVALAPTQTLPLDVTMGVAGVSETVNVVGRSTSVLTQTAQVATDFKQELIQMLPTNRSINSTLLISPSVHPTGPSGAYSFNGAMSFETLFMVNGVTVSENLRGQPDYLYIEDAIQETTINTGGVSAEFGRFGGGVVNVITKSGSNLFSGSFRDTLYNDDWRSYVTGNTAHPFTADCATCGAGGTSSKINAIVPTYEYTLGGPIMKDHLWFFTAGRLQDQSLGRSTVAPLNIPYTFQDNTKRFEGKGTYSINSNHKFQAGFIKINEDQINSTFNTATSMDLNSLYNRQLPQDLSTFNYSGILSPSLFVEGRFSVRHQSFIGSGSTSTDLINGTLLLDRARGNLRYWQATFCGVCDPEKRDNNDLFLKGSYFLSNKGAGTHSMTFGYDTYDDKRFANNHQSGSDFRILGTTTIIRGTNIFPQFLPSSTILQYNPISTSSLGTAFRTHSFFYNDNWRYSNNVTFNLGLRYDRNHGEDSAGNLVAADSAFSPRVGVVWDPKGDGRWSVTGSFAKYVAGISNAIADSSSAAGNPATLQYTYTGAAINPDLNVANPVTSGPAIQQIFDWFNANGGTKMLPSASSVPGVSVKIPGGLASPHNLEYAAGVSHQLGDRVAVRADYTYRTYKDFYNQVINPSTGTVVDQFGNRSDLAIVSNTNDLTRRYSGLSLQGTYRMSATVDFGGNYTISRLWGNFDGENANSGPLTSDIFQYPEYRNISWYAPEGDLSSDQRHKATLWLNYGVPRLDGFTVSLLENMASGLPYGAVGLGTSQGGGSGVNAIPYVTNPGYATPQGGSSETYYFSARDAFHTEAQFRTDLALNYVFGGLKAAGGHKVELFTQLQILNLFNQQALCGCGADVFTNGGAVQLTRIGQSVLTPVTTASLKAFNPLTDTPVLGTNWNYGSNFGTPLNRFAFTSPRTLRIGFGVRF